jgi:hypothetical protein
LQAPIRGNKKHRGMAKKPNTITVKDLSSWEPTVDGRNEFFMKAFLTISEK